MWFCGKREVEMEEEEELPSYCGYTGFEKDSERGEVCGLFSW